MSSQRCDLAPGEQVRDGTSGTVPGVSSCRSRPSSSASSRGSYLMSCTLDSRMSISSFKSCTARKKTSAFTEHSLCLWDQKDKNRP